MIRLLSSLVAAVALVLAMVTPSLAACESSAAAGTDVATAMDGPGHAAHGATNESDCPDSGAPPGGDRDDGCGAMCLTMLGCLSPSFVAGTMLDIPAIRAPLVPSAVSAAHLSPFLAPDRPPPRS
ncbi:MAG: hypothetical protein IT356_00260 [Gemmatimonadaceae bacterium]|nr:hypothetical protein [Gemmatimonadaceae bacterium]